jgi:hypothetical protein
MKDLPPNDRSDLFLRLTRSAKGVRLELGGKGPWVAIVVTIFMAGWLAQVIVAVWLEQ